MPSGIEQSRTNLQPPSTTYLVEWWEAGGKAIERPGAWAEYDDAAAALAGALAHVDDAWTARVRVTMLVGNANIGAVSTGRGQLEAWRIAMSPLPEEAAGPVLPPRSPDDIRGEVIDGCRDALSLALRAKLIDRDRVMTLLLEIDKSFDAGLLETDEPES